MRTGISKVLEYGFRERREKELGIAADGGDGSDD